MAKFLIDENLSPDIAFYLRKLGYRAKAIRELGLRGEPDDIILDFAAKYGWIIITSDIEFGKFFYEKLGQISMIVLRSPKQNLQIFAGILEKLHYEEILPQLLAQYYLVLASPKSTRIRKYQKNI